jgi:hypothetical protein
VLVILIVLLIGLGLRKIGDWEAVVDHDYDREHETEAEGLNYSLLITRYSLLLRYSARSAIIGSTFAARLAGSQQATRATMASSPETAVKVHASKALI